MMICLLPFILLVGPASQQPQKRAPRRAELEAHTRANGVPECIQGKHWKDAVKNKPFTSSNSHDKCREYCDSDENSLTQEFRSFNKNLRLTKHEFMGLGPGYCYCFESLRNPTPSTKCKQPCGGDP